MAVNPDLPDPLVLKNGQKVPTAKMWWDQRRAEIVEDFDREIYGRVPAVAPKVTWRSPAPPGTGETGKRKLESRKVSTKEGPSRRFRRLRD